MKLDALVPGGSITVYSRQLSVIDAANEYTKQLIKKRANKALFVVRPRGYAHMGKVIQVIESSGLVLLNTVMAQLERSHANALNVHCLRSTASDSEDMDDLLRDVSVLIEVKQPTPNTLEDALNRLETAHLRQHVLVGEIGLLDAFAFSSSASSKASSSNKSNGSAIFPSTAVFDNCSLCLLRPRMLRESHVGEILDAILKAGFEISAIKTLHFQMNDADEFFRVYKGIVRQYHVSSLILARYPSLPFHTNSHANYRMPIHRRFSRTCALARASRSRSVVTTSCVGSASSAAPSTCRSRRRCVHRASARSWARQTCSTPCTAPTASRTACSRANLSSTP